MATAALAVGTANAQFSAPQFRQGIQKQILVSQAKGTALLQPNQTLSRIANNGNSILLNKYASRADGAERDPKVLSYLKARESYNNDELSLVNFNIAYDQIANYRIGFGAYYPVELLSKYAGNKLTNIIFVPYANTFKNCQVFVMNPNTGETLYTKNCEKDIVGGAVNGVSIDYTIDGKTPLIIGYSAYMSENEEDPNKSYGLLTPTLPDPTNAGAGAYMLADVNDGNGLQVNASYSNTGTGRVDAAPIWIETSGENGLKTLDAYVEGSNPMRSVGVNGSPLHQMTVMNMGVEPITALNYTVSLRDKVDGHVVREVKGQQKFETPIDFFNAYVFFVNSVLPDTPTWAVDSVNITTVNGNVDGNPDDNSVQYIVYSLGNNPPKRRALVENFTSSASGYAPTGLVGMEALSNKYDFNDPDVVNDVNIVNIHTNYNGSVDPLTDVSYDPAVKFLNPNIPVAYINRVGNTDPYSGESSDVINSASEGIVATMEAYLKQNPYCEANVGVGSQYDEATEKVNVTGRISFNFDTEKGDYSVGYILTENQLSGTQTNAYSGYSNLPSDLAFLGKNRNTYTADYNNVSRYATNPQGIVQHEDGLWYYNDTEGSALPALKAGELYTHNASFGMPDGVDVNASNVIIVVYDNKTKEVVNSASAWMNYTTTGIEKGSVAAPEAMVTVSNGAFNVTAQNATAEVYSVDGKLVSSCTVNGSASLPTFGHGVYVLRVVQDGKAYSKKACF